MGKPRKLVKTDSKEDVTGPEPEKINLDDQQAIKNKLDCTVADVGAPAAASPALPMASFPDAVSTAPENLRFCVMRDRYSVSCDAEQQYPTDCATQVVLNCGYEEDFLISNVKLVLGMLA